MQINKEIYVAFQTIGRAVAYRMWILMKKYLLNMKNYPYRWHIAMVRGNKQLSTDIQSFYPQGKIYVAKNCGYNAGPLIHQPGLTRYDWVLKSIRSYFSPVHFTLNKYHVTQKRETLSFSDVLLASPQGFILAEHKL